MRTKKANNTYLFARTGTIDYLLGPEMLSGLITPDITVKGSCQLGHNKILFLAGLYGILNEYDLSLLELLIVYYYGCGVKPYYIRINGTGAAKTVYARVKELKRRGIIGRVGLTDLGRKIFDEFNTL